MTVTMRRPLCLLIDAFGLTLIYAAAIVVVNTTVYATEPEFLGQAILIDLTLSAAFIHWFFGIRSAGLPRWTLLIVLGTGFVVAGMLVPGIHTGGGTLALAIAVALELAVLGMVVWRAAALAKAFRAARREGAAGFEALESALESVLEMPRLAAMVRAEMEMIVWALAGWFKRPFVTAGAKPFTVYRKVGWFPIVAMLSSLSVLEGGLVYFFLARSDYALLAAIITFLHVYGLVWLIGDAQGFRLFPILIDDERLHLRFGSRWYGRFDHSTIDRAEPVSGKSEKGLELRLFGDPNVAINLQEECEIRGPFGIRRRASRILLAVDEPESFVNALNENPQAEIGDGE